MTFHIGMLLYPGLTQLDLTGPFELLSRLPDAKIHLAWKDRNPVFADSGLGLLQRFGVGQQIELSAASRHEEQIDGRELVFGSRSPRRPRRAARSRFVARQEFRDASAH
jgi:putative intracellular protease/amidase